MDFFPIAAIIIATFLLLVGIVGRGASMGSSQFHITLEGSIGRLPRVAILAASIVTYMVAIFGFVYVADSKSSSQPSPATSASVEAPAIEDTSSAMTVKITSSLSGWDSGDVIEEHDKIIVAESEPLLLDMDTDYPDANGAIYLDESLTGTEVDYSVEVAIIHSDGTEEKYSGEGTITAGDGLEYGIVIDEDGTAALSP